MNSFRVKTVFVSVLILLTVGGITQAGWRSEGPFCGQINCVAIDPARPDTIYIATSYAGVWRSDDRGLTWTLPGDELTSRKVFWVEVDRANPSIVWAGVKKSGGPGLWQSTDRGKSWKVVPIRSLDRQLVIAPSQPEVIFLPTTNLHYRSSDGGKSWTEFRVDGQDVYTFAIHPENPQIVFAGGRGSEKHFSRSEDGGKTWTQTGDGLPAKSIKSLLVDHSSPSTIYAVVSFGELYKSTNSGDTWSRLGLELQGTSELFRLVMDPRDSKVLFAATEEGLMKSTDGGVKWTRVVRTIEGYFCHDLVFDPQRPGTLYAGCPGNGFFRSTDGGAHWIASNEGFTGGWSKQIYASPRQPGLTFAQMGVGLFRRDGSGGWTKIKPPFADRWSPGANSIFFDRTAAGTVYGFDGSGFWRSRDGGSSWTEFEVKQPGMKAMMQGKMSTVQFNSVVQDPADPKTFYAGSRSNRDPGTAVFKTTNDGKKWLPSGTGLPIAAVSMLWSDQSGTVIALVEKNGLYRTTNGGESWSKIGSGLPDDEIKQLAIDPTTPARMFAATEKGLYRSTDGGGSWSRVTSGLEDDEVNAVVVSSRDGQVFAGAFHGVFRSSDGGTTWAAMNHDLPITDVRCLAIEGSSPGSIHAGMAGGSIYSTELP